MSPLERGVVEFIREGGEGGEASVVVELRSHFPGIGGDIVTDKGALVASRREKNIVPGSGNLIYLRHALVKKLDDYFLRRQAYRYAHISRPLGSISLPNEDNIEAYFYEWAYGTDGFSWVSNGGEDVSLREWNTFVDHFSSAGINVGMDIAESYDARVSKNIVHHFPGDLSDDSTLSSIWRRIDFGPNSMMIDYESLSRFLYDNRPKLAEVLRMDRYEMVQLMAKILNYQIRDKVTEKDIVRLEMLVKDYRRSSLHHHTSMGSNLNGPTYFVSEHTSSLVLPGLITQPL